MQLGFARPAACTKVAPCLSVLELPAITGARTTPSSVSLCLRYADVPGAADCRETSGPGSSAKTLAAPGVGLLDVMKSAQLRSVSLPSGKRLALRPVPPGDATMQPVPAPPWYPSAVHGSTRPP